MEGLLSPRHTIADESDADEADEYAADFGGKTPVAVPGVAASAMRKMVAGRLPRLTDRLKESAFGNPDAGTRYDDNLFQALKIAGFMDLPPQIQHNLMRLSLLLYRKNPQAFASVDVKVDYTVGTGCQIVAKDPQVADLLEKHWEDNDWNTKLPERVRALGITGELLLPVHTRPIDGFVRVRNVSAMKIIDVQADSEDAEEPSRVFTMKGELGQAGAYYPGGVMDLSMAKEYAVIGRMEPITELERAAFYFALNRPDGALRGVPDLCSSLDWMEGLDGLVFSLLERAQLTQNVVFDLEYEGLDENELRKKVRNFVNSMKSGGVFAHNEKTKLNIKSPNLAAQDAKQIVDIVKNQGTMGARLAGMFIGSAEDLTTGTAKELALPVEKHLQGRQFFIKNSVKRILRYQIEASRRAGMLVGVKDFRFDLKMPRLMMRDMGVVGSAIQLVGIGLQLAQQNGWINKPEASNAFRTLLTDLGVDVAEQELIETQDVNAPTPGAAPTVDLNAPAPDPAAAAPAVPSNSLSDESLKVAAQEAFKGAEALAYLAKRAKEEADEAHAKGSRTRQPATAGSSPGTPQG